MSIKLSCRVQLFEALPKHTPFTYVPFFFIHYHYLRLSLLDNGIVMVIYGGKLNRPIFFLFVCYIALRILNDLIPSGNSIENKQKVNKHLKRPISFQRNQRRCLKHNNVM